MGKKILAGVVGYIAMAICVFATFSIAYLIMGTEGAFEPNSYDVSTAWVLVTIVLGFAAAVVGGFVCANIAKNSVTHKYLAGFVLILGLAVAVLEGAEPPPSTRQGDVGNFEAMSVARQPTWFNYLNPLLGVAGILVGGRLRKDSADNHG